MRRYCFSLLVAALTMAATGTVARAAGQRSGRRARRVAITRLFSTPADRHPRATLPDTPYYYCEGLNGDPTAMACCVWNQRELHGFGAWDCSIDPALDVAADVLSRPTEGPITRVEAQRAIDHWWLDPQPPPIQWQHDLGRRCALVMLRIPFESRDHVLQGIQHELVRVRRIGPRHYRVKMLSITLSLKVT